MTDPIPAPVPEPAPAEAQAPAAWTGDAVRDVLRHVMDPELHINIVDLGLVYGVAVSDAKVDVKMTLTSPGCPYGPYLLHQVKDTCMSLKGIQDAQIEVVWDPPWGPDKMTEEVRLELGFDV
jgi:metal-sulfur cluster biosynthetic enzyme